MIFGHFVDTILLYFSSHLSLSSLSRSKFCSSLGDSLVVFCCRRCCCHRRCHLPPYSPLSPSTPLPNPHAITRCCCGTPPTPLPAPCYQCMCNVTSAVITQLNLADKRGEEGKHGLPAAACWIGGVSWTKMPHTTKTPLMPTMSTIH